MCLPTGQYQNKLLLLWYERYGLTELPRQPTEILVHAITGKEFVMEQLATTLMSVNLLRLSANYAKLDMDP